MSKIFGMWNLETFEVIESISYNLCFGLYNMSDYTVQTTNLYSRF